VLVDREFYRAALVHDLTAQGIPMLMPTKSTVDHPADDSIPAWNRGRGVWQRVHPSFKQYPNQSAAFVRLVLIGHDDKASWEVREQYAQGTLSFDEAINKLAGFYTTLAPWKNQDAWARYLARLYKRRWSVETGFRSSIRCTLTSGAAPRAEMGGPIHAGWAYDLWQFWAFNHARRGYLRAIAPDRFSGGGAGVVREILLASACKLIESS